MASSCVVRCFRVYIRSLKDVTGCRSVTQPVVAKKSNLMQLLLPQKSVFFFKDVRSVDKRWLIMAASKIFFTLH